jgi:LPS export ABC transporter protein LptC
VFTLRIHPKQILLFLITGLLIFLSFSLISGFKKRSFSVGITNPVGKADVKIGQFSFVQTHEGRQEWKLKAEKAEVFEEEQKVHLKEIAVTIQTPQGLELKLDGDEGIIDTFKKDFSLRKKNELMVIQLSNGYTIKTSGLKWFNDQRELITEGAAHISGPQVEIDGKELKVAIENQEVTVSGDVQAWVY